MFDAFGPLLRVELAAWLWLVPMLPIAAFVLSGYLALSAEPPQRATMVDRRLMIYALSSAAAALALMGGRWGHDSVQLCHVFRLVRVGRIDLSLDLALDAIGLFIGVGVSVASAALALVPSRTDARERVAAYGPLLTAGALVVVLADNVPTALMGGVFASLAAALATGRARAFYIDRLSDACLLAGAVALAWALGGGFTGGEFTSDMNPRLVVASSTQQDALAGAVLPLTDDDDDDRPRGPRKPTVIKDLTAGGEGSLTVLSPPGSFVFVDDTRTPLLGPDKMPLRAPIVRFPLSAGIHAVRVRPSEGEDDTIAPHVVVATGRDVRLTLIGPTTSLRELNEEFGLKHLQEESSFRSEVLAHEAWPKTRLTSVAAVLLALGVLLRIACANGVIEALSAWPWLAVAARAATLLSFEPSVALALAVVSAVLAILMAGRAARGVTLTETLGYGASAKGLLALAAIASGAIGPAALDAGAALVALVVLVRAGKTATDELGEAVSVPRAPSPWSLVWVGAAFTLVLAPTAVTALAASFGEGGARGLGLLIALLLATALLSRALFRAFAIAIAPRGKPKKKGAALPDSRAWVALGFAALASTVLLGFDARTVDGDAALSSRMVRDVMASAPSIEPPSQGTLIALTLVWLGIVAGVSALARRQMQNAKTRVDMEAMDSARALDLLVRASRVPAVLSDRLGARWTALMVAPPALAPRVNRGSLVIASWALAGVIIVALALGVAGR